MRDSALWSKLSHHVHLIIGAYPYLDNYSIVLALVVPAPRSVLQKEIHLTVLSPRQ